MMEKLYDMTIMAGDHTAEFFFATEKDATKAGAMIRQHVCPAKRRKNIIIVNSDQSKPVAECLKMYGFAESDDIGSEPDDWSIQDWDPER